MNPSRDIEKLFEHFGGNAGDYQEIGRENEARSARTRWPLLATLDFTQPAIPEVAQRRDVQLPHARGTRSDAEADAAPTPINRGKPPLFARAHRRTIPPVGNVTLPAVPPGGSRFGELASAEPEQAQTPSPAAIRPATPVVPAASVSREAQAPLRGVLGVPPAMPAAQRQHALCHAVCRAEAAHCSAPPRRCYGTACFLVDTRQALHVAGSAGRTAAPRRNPPGRPGIAPFRVRPPARLDRPHRQPRRHSRVARQPDAALMKVITVVSAKGGVGKTTLAANLASVLAARGRRVIALDLDPQNALRLHFGIPLDSIDGHVARHARRRRLADRDVRRRRRRDGAALRRGARRRPPPLRGAHRP